MTIKSCPQCGTLYLTGADICDWCAIATSPVHEKIAPIVTRPAIPAECWNSAPIDTDSAMAAVRSLCGG